MDQATHNKVVSFLWGIADDVVEKESEGLLDELLRGSTR